MTGLYRKILFATAHSLILGASLAVASPARAEGPGSGEVTAVSLAPSGGKAEVVIAVRGAVDVRDFVLASPDRLVLDVVGAKLSDAAPAVYDGVKRGGVVNLRYSQFRPDIVRIVIDLDAPKAYEVERRGESIRIAFGSDQGYLIGGLDYLFYQGVAWDKPQDGLAIPMILFATYQGMFAIITPALISGAFAERMKFTGYLLFLVLWSTLVYSPICHWVWGGGWLGARGVHDFAGGTVVHISSGVAALAAALVIGKRKGYPETAMIPHNLPWCVLGAGILWFGWFGFNGGSALASNGVAALAFTTTHLAAATAALTWLALEHFLRKQGTMLGFATGAVAGLVGITPAAGFVSPLGAVVIGAATSCACYLFVSKKEKLGYDDSLDAFGVHGVGGTVGAILTGVFCLQPLYLGEGDIDRAGLIVKQVAGAGVTIVYAFIVSFILLKIVDATVGLRVPEDVEETGLDVSLHGESGYTD